MNVKKCPEEYQREYRQLADRVREAAHTASTETERADLLDRAKTWGLPSRPSCSPRASSQS